MNSKRATHPFASSTTDILKKSTSMSDKVVNVEIIAENPGIMCDFFPTIMT